MLALDKQPTLSRVKRPQTATRRQRVARSALCGHSGDADELYVGLEVDVSGDGHTKSTRTHNLTILRLVLYVQRNLLYFTCKIIMMTRMTDRCDRSVGTADVPTLHSQVLARRLDRQILLLRAAQLFKRGTWQARFLTMSDTAEAKTETPEVKVSIMGAVVRVWAQTVAYRCQAAHPYFWKLARLEGWFAMAGLSICDCRLLLIDLAAAGRALALSRP